LEKKWYDLQKRYNSICISMDQLLLDALLGIATVATAVAEPLTAVLFRTYVHLLLEPL